LKVYYGQIVAIVGPSGAGKSSLVNLLIRFFDPVSGSIEIDGHNLKDWKLSVLRSQVGYVTQDVVLFNDTVAYNISYANINAKEEEIKNAARLAHADEFIQNLPQGYQTVIGEKGCSLSGGQRQRIAIARAILLNPSVLILDEATSALDSESEKLIQDAIERLMKGRTVLCIAHRLSTIKKSDRIILMDKGSILHEGAHESLLEKSTLYKKLYELQFNM
jgi:subfamily B ATP-binding cassette protein MsbA